MRRRRRQARRRRVTCQGPPACAPTLPRLPLSRNAAADRGFLLADPLALSTPAARARGGVLAVPSFSLSVCPLLGASARDRSASRSRGSCRRGRRRRGCDSGAPAAWRCGQKGKKSSSALPRALPRASSRKTRLRRARAAPAQRPIAGAPAGTPVAAQSAGDRPAVPRGQRRAAARRLRADAAVAAVAAPPLLRALASRARRPDHPAGVLPPLS